MLHLMYRSIMTCVAHLGDVTIISCLLWIQSVSTKQYFDVRLGTAGAANSGSNTGLSMDIQGDRGTARLVLIPPGTDLGRVSFTNVAVVTDTAVGKVKAVGFTALGNDKWEFDWFSVSERSTGRLWFFSCDPGDTCGVDGNGDDVFITMGDIFDVAYETTDLTDDGSGHTNTGVNISLYGSHGNTDKMFLLPYGWMQLQYTVNMTSFMTGVTIGAVTAVRFDAMGYNGWHLGKFQVMNRRTGERWDMQCYCDIDNDGPPSTYTNITIDYNGNHTVPTPVPVPTRDMFLTKHKNTGIIAKPLSSHQLDTRCLFVHCLSHCFATGCAAFQMSSASSGTCTCVTYGAGSHLQQAQLTATTSSDAWIPGCLN